MNALRILWFNWRCIKHPLSGGAEIYTHEIAKRLVKYGHEVLLFTSRHKDLPREEFIEGYRTIRAGNRYTVYLHAKKVYEELKRSHWKPDVVIDEINTIPFLTPKYIKEPIVVLIHQLCKDCWKYAIHPIIQPLGWWLERELHRVYTSNVKKGKLKAVVTVSESTKGNLVELGYPEHLIHIVHNGLDWELYKDCTGLCKEKDDLVVYVGRISPYKKLEDLIKAWKTVEELKYNNAKLLIAGKAYPKYLKKLIALANKLNLKNVEFRTNVSQQEKKKLLASAKVLAYPSIREGWGQPIIEAAACKTPAVAYNVPGLKDSIKHMNTGILIEPRNVDQLAKAIVQLLVDKNLREGLAEKAYKYAQQFSWERATKNFVEIIERAMHN